jgi:hypothetical protein
MLRLNQEQRIAIVEAIARLHIYEDLEYNIIHQIDENTKIIAYYVIEKDQKKIIIDNKSGEEKKVPLENYRIKFYKDIDSIECFEITKIKYLSAKQLVSIMIDKEDLINQFDIWTCKRVKTLAKKSKRLRSSERLISSKRSKTDQEEQKKENEMEIN